MTYLDPDQTPGDPRLNSSWQRRHVGGFAQCPASVRRRRVWRRPALAGRRGRAVAGSPRLPMAQRSSDSGAIRRGRRPPAELVDSSDRPRATRATRGGGDGGGWARHRDDPAADRRAHASGGDRAACSRTAPQSAHRSVGANASSGGRSCRDLVRAASDCDTEVGRRRVRSGGEQAGRRRSCWSQRR